MCSIDVVEREGAYGLLGCDGGDVGGHGLGGLDLLLDDGRHLRGLLAYCSRSDLLM
jgi:hypothetical protein